MPHPMTTPVLEVRGLCKRFPGVVALDHVDFRAHAGEVHALIGENGAGKSTLMNILGGALTADAGEILVDGRAARLRAPVDSQRLGISQVPQGLGVMPNLSVGENIHVGAELRWGPWVDWRQMHASSSAALERLGARLDPRTPVWQLGALQQVLVVIARAVARDARVLVLDEPTATLPERDSEQLLEVLCGLRRDGMAIVYISRRLNQIYALADRVTVLHDGRAMGTLEGEHISTAGVIALMCDTGRAGTGAAPRRLDGALAPARTRTPAPPLPAVLQVRELTDGSRIKPASFDIRSGEVVGLTGLVGSGRSRLSRLLCGAELRRGGDIRFGGRPCNFRVPAQALRAGIAYVPESEGDAGLFPRMSAQDNVTMGLVGEHRKLGLFCDDAELGRRCRAALLRLRLQLPRLRRWTTDLSQGTRHKLLLARGLVMSPKLLILDEPTKGLDGAAKADVEAAVRELAALGTAILWVSAQLPEIISLCDRTLVMCEGEIAGMLDPAQGDDYSEATMLAYATGLRHDRPGKLAW